MANKRMSIAEMRSYVLAAYPSKSWQERAMNMPPKQIAAIYNSFVERSKQEEESVPLPKGVRDMSIPPMERPNHQITMFEYINSLDMQKEEAGE